MSSVENDKIGETRLNLRWSRVRAAPPVYSRMRRCQIMRVTGCVYVNRSEVGLIELQYYRNYYVNKKKTRRHAHSATYEGLRIV